MKRITTAEMEIALARYFNFRQNLIVPNVSWGLYLNRTCLHECDLLILTKSGYLWEVEIKISKSDLVADKKKNHGHRHDSIKRLYFAIPEHINTDCCIEHIPKRAGVIVVKNKENLLRGGYKTNYWYCKQERKPKEEKGHQLTEKERFKVARLGAMRIWGLKDKLVKSR